jgi:2-polyprenyl-3-methyl-5-hydroxy-6-metoxy-1,4-benzoquinol methylase
MVLGQIRNSFSKIKLDIQGGYNAKKYWEVRHKKYGFDPKGVGNKSLSNKENALQYHEARKIFLAICEKNSIDFSRISVLDIGCGSGFYTKILWDKGCVDYTGIDITDVLFNGLKERFPHYRFKQLDITKKQLQDLYDLIIMIDVSQHITYEKKFKFAMQNVKEHLKRSGLFIVTSWLNKTAKKSFYEKSRSIEIYKNCFKTENFSDPIKFRDKFIFTVQNMN